MQIKLQKTLFTIIVLTGFWSNIYAKESLGNESEIQSQEIKNHFLDLGVGIGLDYGGILGILYIAIPTHFCIWRSRCATIWLGMECRNDFSHITSK